MENDFANKLVELRKRAGLTQDELAQKLNLTPQSISKYERGEANPDISYLVPMCDALGCTLDELMGLSNVNYIEGRKPRKLVIKVLSEDGDKVNLNLPYFLVKGMAKTFLKSGNLSKALEGIDLNVVFEAAESGAFGKILEVDSSDGDHVEISVE